MTFVETRESATTQDSVVT